MTTSPADGRPDAAGDAFADVLAANRRYAETFDKGHLEARAARGIAIVTCMDSRIDPLGMAGLAPGDAKILRNAGARVSDDVLRTLVLAIYLLGVERIMVTGHTRCAMYSSSEAELHAGIRAAGGPDTRSLAFGASIDQEATLARDVLRVRTHPFVPARVTVEGFLYDVTTGLLRRSAR